MYKLAMYTDPRLDACHCFAFRRGSRYIARLYDRYLAPAEIKSSQFTLLTALDQRVGIHVAQLADLMVMERTTLVRALKPLQAAGWVLQEPSGNGRANVWKLTPTGAEKVAECLPYWTAAQEEFEETLGRRQAASIKQNNLAISALARVSNC